MAEQTFVFTICRVFLRIPLSLITDHFGKHVLTDRRANLRRAYTAKTAKRRLKVIRQVQISHACAHVYWFKKVKGVFLFERQLVGAAF